MSRSLISAAMALGLTMAACEQGTAARGGVAQIYGMDAGGGVPSPMPSTPLFEAGAAPLPSTPVPSTPVPSAPESPTSPPGNPFVPPGTPTNPGTPSSPGTPPGGPVP